MNAAAKPSRPSAEDAPAILAFRELVRTLGLLRHVMEPYFARHGISGAQWGILRALHRAEGEKNQPVRLVDLSAKLLVRPPSVTSAISRLTKLYLVALTPSATDQRVKLVSLTAAGRKLVDKILEGHGEKIGGLMAILDESEQLHLSTLLGRVSKHLETLVEAEHANED